MLQAWANKQLNTGFGKPASATPPPLRRGSRNCASSRLPTVVNVLPYLRRAGWHGGVRPHGGAGQSRLSPASTEVGRGQRPRRPLVSRAGRVTGRVNRPRWSSPTRNGIWRWPAAFAFLDLPQQSGQMCNGALAHPGRCLKSFTPSSVGASARAAKIFDRKPLEKGTQMGPLSFIGATRDSPRLRRKGPDRAACHRRWLIARRVSSTRAGSFYWRRQFRADVAPEMAISRRRSRP